MALFENKVRTEMRPRRQNEAAFAFMNLSARPSMESTRCLLESWFDNLPDTAKSGIQGDFRSPIGAQHHGAFYELFWHQLLLCSGYDVEVHPAMANVPTKPDFLAKRGDEKFYLEAKLAMPSIDGAADRRLAVIHDALDAMDSPDFFLEMEWSGTLHANIPFSVLRRKLEGWLRGLDPKEISRLYLAHSHEKVPTYTWPDPSSAQEFSISFTPIPKGPSFRGQPGVRAIGIAASSEPRVLSTHDDIKASIEVKAKKYGDVQLPMVIAVNVMDDFCDDDDIWNGLLGQQQFVAIRQSDGTWRHEAGTRVPNGAWYGRAGARNQMVSAVAITNQLLPTTLRACPVELIHNPWALRPLEAGALQLPQRTINLTDGRHSRREGVSASDLLSIPDPWPVRDAN